MSAKADSGSTEIDKLYKNRTGCKGSISSEPETVFCVLAIQNHHVVGPKRAESGNIPYLLETIC